MSIPGDLSTSPTATVVPTGRPTARRLITLGIVLTAISALVLFGGVVMAAGLGDGGPNPKGIAGIVIGLFMGFIGVMSLITTWSARHAGVSVDHRELWVGNGKAQNVIPWQSLAGLGLHWSKVGKRGLKVYSIELCPSAPSTATTRSCGPWSATRNRRTPPFLGCATASLSPRAPGWPWALRSGSGSPICGSARPSVRPAAWAFRTAGGTGSVARILALRRAAPGVYRSLGHVQRVSRSRSCRAWGGC
ncbi:hypothetical protein N8I84_29035 [Streptomyces cynarae]|uniref:Uncharacterized protein n=1 Tax=Streptomyces cynarae TaxID=2981134 RepID=A0ABY6E6J7_9ACTN|nr:hypothetical protein [Streptomyces cynarae]UXY22291.1 hypothetical protein N8I84_29035 [Streptomyces cynarae]